MRLPVFRGNRFFLVLPVDKTLYRTPLAESAHLIIDAAKRQAQGFVQGPVEVVAIDTRKRFVSKLYKRKRPPVSGLFPVCYVFMNMGCLVSDEPPFEALLKAAEQSGAAWIGEESNGDMHAFALCPAFPVPGLFDLFRRFEPLWRVLSRLTICIEDQAHDRGRLPRLPVIRPGPSSIENSPAMVEVKGARSGRWANAPVYLNTAMREVVLDPQDPNPIGNDPRRMCEALLSQRSVSRVPWIFNTLINDIEYREGYTRPQSFPPEIHLSLTGRCNLECRFCSYTHEMSRRDVVCPEDLDKLGGVLKNIQTFRLHSGLGEPTMNPRLAQMIDCLSDGFPQLGINFFTNGLLLNRFGLIQSMVGKVRWINVSLNAATASTWKAVCQNDQFDPLCGNLRQLHREKERQGRLWPLVHGSMVLNAATIADLPRMPRLCRSLGIDRLTLFPFFALGYAGPGKYGADMTLEACRDRFEALYEETVREAQEQRVSIEIPPPSNRSRIVFGMEVRHVHDFARIESNEWPLGRFLNGLNFRAPPEAYCHFLWRTAAIGSTNNSGHSMDETHFLYPCIGPLSSVDLSRRTPFRFEASEGFLTLWQNSVFTILRRAQHGSGICEVCDMCRSRNTRDPAGFEALERAVGRFSATYS